MLDRLERIDRFGYCVMCTKNMLTKRVVDGKVIEMFTPDHGHTEFLLDSGSRMQVCMCRQCRENVDLTKSSIQKMIMDSVQKGWELEVKALVADENQSQWTEQFGKNHLEVMSKLNIDCHSESMDKVAVESRQLELVKELGVKDGIN